MLELKNINFTRDGKKILNNINIKINDNEVVVITGPNGSGKSTLAKIIMGIETADSGSILYDKLEITNKKIYERANLGISFAFQQPIKFKGITVKNLIQLSVGKKIGAPYICEYLKEVGLCPKEYINREINASLSGGELKRIEIATVLAKNGKIIIFDEPEAGIDLWSFSKMIKIFEKMKNKKNCSIVIISHQERILKIADKIILIKNGKVEENGNKETLLPKIFDNIEEKV